MSKRIPLEVCLLIPSEVYNAYHWADVKIAYSVAVLEAEALNALMKEKGSWIDCTDVDKVKRINNIGRPKSKAVSRADRLHAFMCVEKMIEKKINNYMVKTYGYC